MLGIFFYKTRNYSNFKLTYYPIAPSGKYNQRYGQLPSGQRPLGFLGELIGEWLIVSEMESGKIHNLHGNLTVNKIGKMILKREFKKL